MGHLVVSDRTTRSRRDMSRYTLKCVVMGHDDQVRRAPGRLYLQCADCGRTTPGWDLRADGAAQTTVPAHVAPDRVRWPFWEMLRGRFHVAGTR